MRLENKSVVLYGAEVPPDAALVQVLARGRAIVFAADRVLADAEQLVQAVVDAGGVAEAAEVEFLDQQAVEEYAAETAAWAGGLDIAVVAMRGEEEDTRLSVTRATAATMAARGFGIILVFCEDGALSPDFGKIAEEVADNGVKMLPVEPGRKRADDAA